MSDSPLYFQIITEGLFSVTEVVEVTQLGCVSLGDKFQRLKQGLKGEKGKGKVPGGRKAGQGVQMVCCGIVYLKPVPPDKSSKQEKDNRKGGGERHRCAPEGEGFSHC